MSTFKNIDYSKIELHVLAQLCDTYYRNIYKRKQIPMTNQFQGRDSKFLWIDSVESVNEKFAPVCNYEIYRRFAIEGYIPKNVLLLAHEVASNPKEWEETFNDPKWNDTTIIMDNSVVELGKAVDTKMVEEAADCVTADIVVLPDVLSDGPKTINAIEEVFDDWVWRFKDYELMALIQGKNFNEWLKCAETLRKHFTTPWIGIPRCAEGIEYDNGVYHRKDLVEFASMIFPNAKFHLFGFSDYIWEDIKAAKCDRVCSIDSNAPLRIPEEKLDHLLSYTIPKRFGFSEMKFNHAMIEACKKINTLINR